MDDYYSKRDEKKSKWDRVLPFGDYFVDRWEKAAYLGFGEGTSIYDNSLVLGDVKVGSHTWIGPNTILDGTGEGLVIGNFCSISAGVQIYTHDTVKYCISGGTEPKAIGEVVIEDNCYIAPLVIIAKDVVIGHSSIVCANSFVNKCFEPYSIIAGCPAKKIGCVRIENGTVKLAYDSGVDK